ncbi:MAG: hypothetical protein MUC89_24085, partial [Acetobacteraceae bacterium]|nr:hypothetical protein [Acetobacteraceae bacterium]
GLHVSTRPAGCYEPEPRRCTRSGRCGAKAASGGVVTPPEVLVGDVLELRGGVRQPFGLAPKHRLGIRAEVILAGLTQLDTSRNPDVGGATVGRQVDPSKNPGADAA